MNPLQIIIDFFKEVVNRIGTKSPMFFKVLQVLGASLTFAGYVPSMLQQWFGVVVSPGIIHVCESVAKYSAGFFASSMLAAKPTVVGQTETGIEVKVTNETKMPFTAKSEAKDIAKTIPPPDVIPEVTEKIDLKNFPDTSSIPKGEDK